MFTHLKLRILDKEILLAILVILAMGLALRLYPGKDHLLWNNSDYGRDMYVMREMINTRDLKLLGPVVSVFDQQKQAYLIFDGPLYYYIMAPFYALSQGDPNLPLLVNIIIHLSTIIPLGILTWQILKNKTAILLTLILAATSYELVEYSRWLLNPSMAMPFLAWFFFCLYNMYQQKRFSLMTGLFLGLAIQNQIFLVYWIVPVIIVLFGKKLSWRVWLKVGTGLTLGLLPLVLAELKFKFRATISLLNFLLHPNIESLTIAEKASRYFEHLNLVAHHNYWGFSDNYSFLAIVVVLLLPIIGYQKLSAKAKTSLPLLYLLFASHSLIFYSNFHPAIYVDLGLGLILIILAVIGQYVLWQSKLWWLSLILVGTVILSQLQLLKTNTQRGTPFGGHFFLNSDTLLFSDRLEVVKKIYELAKGQAFSISVADTPYGWPTVWASVFQTYQIRHQLQLPLWYGFKVNGIPGDKVFQGTDAPLATHFVLKKKIPIIDETTQKVFAAKQDETSILKNSIEIKNMIVEERESKE